MDKILILSGLYPPGISGGSQLCKNIAEGLQKRGHDVYVAPIADSVSGKEIKNDVNVIRLPLKPNLVSKTTGFLAHRLRSGKLLYYNNYSNAASQMKAVEGLTTEIQPHTLITVCYPFFAHIIGNRIKRKYPEIKWIAYYIDPFFSNGQVKAGSNKYIQSRENKTIAKADKIVMLEWMIPEYRACIKKEIYASYIPLNFISADKNVNINQISDKEISFLYCGTLYKGIREPNYLFELFNYYYNYSPEHVKCVVIGKISGYSTQEVELWREKYRDVIKILGPVNHDILESYYRAASVLVSVGNTTTNQMPSKIFEYISMGKPILHIYKIEACPVKKLLNDYPMALCIADGEPITEDLMKRVHTFFEETNGKRIEEQQIKILYSKYLIGNIVQVFE